MVLSGTLFLSPISSYPLLCAARIAGNAFPKEEQVAKRIAEEKSFHPPGLRCEGRLNGTSRQILLIQGLTVGDANSEALYQQYLPTNAICSPLKAQPWGFKEFMIRDPFGNGILFAEHIPEQEA